MIEFIYHDSFQKEIAALERRFRHVRDGLKSFERICEVHFHPINPRSVIPPAKLHRIHQNELWTMWKVELIVPNSGLRPNQFPRMWFAVRGSIIVGLIIGCHMDNYKDIEMERTALSRVSDIF